MSSDLTAALRDVVAGALGDPSLDIDGLRRLTGGASRETWSFTAVTGDEQRPLILRRDLGGEPATGRGFATEVAAINAAREAGVPEPEVLATSDDPTALGAPFVLMEHVEGETLAPRILRDEALAEIRPRLAEQCGEILARIHAIPVESIDGLRQPDPVESLRRDLAAFDEPSPAFELGLRRLEQTRPSDAQEPGLVHGDFRNGNLIVGPDGIRAVLDWELVQIGDPMQDLGHLCARVWRFGGPGPVGGFGDYEDLFRGYERVSGRRVDPAVLRWWELRATLWWGIGCMQMAWRHLSGAARSVEFAAIGRRAWEQEYDVMLLIADQLQAA